MEASSFRIQSDFLSIDGNLGLWLVTYFLLMMKKVRERGRKSEREGVEGKESGGRERESKPDGHRGKN